MARRTPSAPTDTEEPATPTYPDTETVAEETPQTGGWETGPEAPAQPTFTGVPCTRHRWKGGDTCVRCGAPKPARQAAQPRAARVPGAPRSSSGSSIEELTGLLWLLSGLGIEHQPLLARKPTTYHTEQGDVEGASPAEAVGRTVQAQAIVAGRRIDKAWRKGSPLSYAVVNHFLGKVTWMADIAPLLIGPIMVGSAAAKPELLQQPIFRQMMAQAMIPVMVETTKVMEQQAELLEKTQNVSKERVEAAQQQINALLGLDQQQ